MIARFIRSYCLEKFWPPLASDQWAFWVRERARRSRLVDQAPVLFAYYQSGATDLDGAFFAGDKVRAEQHALLLADFLALGQYEAYLQQNQSRFYPK